MNHKPMTRLSFLLRSAIVLGLGLAVGLVPLLGIGLFVYWVYVQIARAQDIGLPSWMIAVTSGAQVLLVLQEQRLASIAVGLVVWAALASIPSGGILVRRRAEKHRANPHFTERTIDLTSGRPMPHLSEDQHFTKRYDVEANDRAENDPAQIDVRDVEALDQQAAVSPQN